MAAYEMNAFKDEYQQKVLANAKAFARALKDCGLDVAGDPAIVYTETHQVILHVGYARGPEIARRLEENNIIVNYQAAPGRGGLYRLRRPAHGGVRNDPLRHGGGGFRGAGPVDPRRAGRRRGRQGRGHPIEGAVFGHAVLLLRRRDRRARGKSVRRRLSRRTRRTDGHAARKGVSPPNEKTPVPVDIGRDDRPTGRSRRGRSAAGPLHRGESAGQLHPGRPADRLQRCHRA